jgi:hypothetical protein
MQVILGSWLLPMATPNPLVMETSLAWFKTWLFEAEIIKSATPFIILLIYT